jgi:asparagine synthase (glutamine-hydrolysing)
MCGITGVLNASPHEPVATETLRAMTDTLVHRGPDDAGFFVRGPVGLGHRRLSIIDLATGDQPLSNEDGTVWLVFNGEIYNYGELRRGLEARGHRFTTQSDTEVIVHQYEEDGVRCVERFRGMFAFAIWDQRERRLVLARDRFGIKPLFVAQSDAGIAFASEMKALLRLPWVNRDWDGSALRAYLTLGYIPGRYTAYRGIRRFAPGTVETWDRAVAGDGWLGTTTRYWQPQVGEESRLTYAEAKDRLHELLLESVRLRLRSDVPLGAFLSGGIDSTTVVALMRRCGVEDLSTFSMGFEEQRYDELAYAQLAARRLRTDHHARIVTVDDISSLPTVLSAFDEPFGDDSAIPTFLVSRLARESVTVALSGDGGDELYAGYDHYRRVGRLARIDTLPLALRLAAGRLGSRVVPMQRRGGHLLRELSVPPERRRLHLPQESERELEAAVLSQPFVDFLQEGEADTEWEAMFVCPSSLTNDQLVDQGTYLPDDILVKVDRCSMAVSLEARVPLLDHVLADFVNSLPPSYKLRDGKAKRILKDVVAPYVPAAVLERPKMGFAIPLRGWLAGPLRTFVEETLCASDGGLFDRAGVHALLASLDEDGPDRSKRVWLLLSLGAWAQAQPSGPL